MARAKGLVAEAVANKACGVSEERATASDERARRAKGVRRGRGT